MAKKSIPFSPLHDFLVIKEIRPGETASGIALPDDADVGDPKGEVVAIGPGRFSEYQDWKPPCPVEVGDTVYLHFVGMSPPREVTEDGETYLMARFRDLLAVKK